MVCQFRWQGACARFSCEAFAEPLTLRLRPSFHSGEELKIQELHEQLAPLVRVFVFRGGPHRPYERENRELHTPGVFGMSSDALESVCRQRSVCA